jgi:RNA polymerase sigma-70 factor (ECF subfamily)
MPVKPANPSMLGVTAAVPIDGLALAPGEARRIDPQTDEAALVEAVRRNDAGSREALYHRYKRRVYALALRIVGVMDAEEVAQEAFIRIFRGLAKFRGDAALSTWIYRLAVNAALSHRARRGNNGAQVEVKDLEGAGADGAIAGGAEPAHGDAVLRARLERALAKLPAGYRTVIVLHDVEGLEHEEVASILGCHVGTSKSQLHKARARLREILAADGITATALENG